MSALVLSTCAADPSTKRMQIPQAATLPPQKRRHVASLQHYQGPTAGRYPPALQAEGHRHASTAESGDHPSMFDTQRRPNRLGGRSC